MIAACSLLDQRGTGVSTEGSAGCGSAGAGARAVARQMAQVASRRGAGGAARSSPKDLLGHERLNIYLFSECFSLRLGAQIDSHQGLKVSFVWFHSEPVMRVAGAPLLDCDYFQA